MKRLLLLLLACALSTGCFVFDEIDNGKAIMEKNAPKPPPDGNAKAGAKAGARAGAKAGGKATAAATAKAGQPGQKTGKDWWATAKSIEPAAESDPGDPNSLASCQVHGATRFMRRGDCLSQGGVPAH
jgi:hypothetical protein